MEKATRSRVAREEWSKRVERWRESGLTCAEFAGEQGINPRTLTYWKWILGKEARGETRVWPRRKGRGKRRPARVQGAAPTLSPPIAGFVEVQVTPGDARFELELGSGRRLRVPTNFDAGELRRLLAALEVS